jgi:hypothetical protein
VPGSVKRKSKGRKMLVPSSMVGMVVNGERGLQVAVEPFHLRSLRVVRRGSDVPYSHEKQVL